MYEFCADLNEKARAMVESVNRRMVYDIVRKDEGKADKETVEGLYQEG